MASRILASVCAARDADLSRSQGDCCSASAISVRSTSSIAARTSGSRASMRASIVGASEGDAPAPRVTMCHLTTTTSVLSAAWAASSDLGALTHRCPGAAPRPRENQAKYASLDAPGAALKTRVSLVQFRPWARDSRRNRRRCRFAWCASSAAIGRPVGHTGVTASRRPSDGGREGCVVELAVHEGDDAGRGMAERGRSNAF